jgi:transposase InsO family protein
MALFFTLVLPWLLIGFGGWLGYQLVRQNGRPVLLQKDNEVASQYQAHGTPMGYLLDEAGAIASDLTRTGAASTPPAEFRRLLQRHRTRPSMSRSACPYDNALMESFFATLKTECFGDQVPKNRAEAQALLFDYIETFYNTQRLHSALGYLSPLEFEILLTQATNHRN